VLEVIVLILFLPVAVYLIWVGSINRQSKPLIVEGTWDFAAMLFAASGLIFFGIPSIISSLNETWRRYWLTGEGPMPFASLEGSRTFWIFLWLFYLVMVVVLAAVLLKRRRNMYVIYNVDPGLVEHSLTKALDIPGMQINRVGNFFTLKDSQYQTEETLEVEVFRPMFNVSFHFSNPTGILCRRVMVSVKENLAEALTPEHRGGLILIFCGCFILFLTIISQFMVAFFNR